MGYAGAYGHLLLNNNNNFFSILLPHVRQLGAYALHICMISDLTAYLMFPSEVINKYVVSYRYELVGLTPNPRTLSSHILFLLKQKESQASNLEEFCEVESQRSSIPCHCPRIKQRFCAGCDYRRFTTE